MRDFKRLEVWKQGHTLTLDCYRASEQLPVDENFGLRSQLRRAAASIPINIAEGCGHSSQRQFARYLRDALASSNEVEYQLLLLRDVSLLDAQIHAKLHRQTCEVRRMLLALLKRVQPPPAQP
ncbi:MAG TPA: four helix bundle protein [Trueperaceae bacterium]|nr:four helix bundle protein [Trueperaceae bacterium]